MLSANELRAKAGEVFAALRQPSHESVR